MTNFSWNKFQWLSRYSPSFYLQGNQISILKEPKDFYAKLLEITSSSKRIVLASLYFGTGTLEQRLIENLDHALVKSPKKDLKIKVILDFNRGSRGVCNSRTMFLPLIKSHPENVKVSLFHSPLLSGLMKKLLPDRFNEVMGLFHMKIYIGDDDVIISGANLSESYFTDRQDRYVFISKCPQLADFFEEILDIVSKYSFNLHEKGYTTFDVDTGLPLKSHKDNKTFCLKFNEEVSHFIEKWKILTNIENVNKNFDTVLHPLIQMGPIQITQDQLVTTKFLSLIPKNSRVNIATGYFNLTSKYIDHILKKDNVSFSILTAAPQANSFYKSSGISGYIPDVYTYIAKSFYCKAMTYMLLQARNTQSTDLRQEPTSAAPFSNKSFFTKMQLLISDKFKNKTENKKFFSDNELSSYTESPTCNNQFEIISTKTSDDPNILRIQLFEYVKKAWTFHAKGLWFYFPHQTLPSLTIIGSSNFGYRSVERDMEAQLIIITQNKNLQTQLHLEECNMFNESKLVTLSTFEEPSRKVSLWISLLLPLILNFF